MVAFYKHDIVAWRKGTAGLSDRAYRVYHVIVEQIMQNESALPYHELSLAGLANRSVRDFRLAFAELTELNLVRLDGRFIRNARAESELEAIEANRVNAAKGGRSKKTRGPFDGNSTETHARESVEHSASSPRARDEFEENLNKNNDGCEAPLVSDSKPKRRREDVDVDEKEDISASACAPADPSQKPKRKSRKKLEESQLSADAQPNEAQRQLAEAAGLDKAAFRFHWQAFRSWFVQREEWRSDWVATWSNWLKKLRPSEKQMEAKSGAVLPFANGPRTVGQRRGEFQDFIAAKAAECFGGPEPPGELIDVTDQSTVIEH